MSSHPVRRSLVAFPLTGAAVVALSLAGACDLAAGPVCNPACPDGQVCEYVGDSFETACQPAGGGAACDPACGAGTVCQHGQCIATGGGGDGCDPPCGAGQTCQGGACVADTPPGPSGAETCAEVMACITACPEADEACPEDCYGRGSGEAQAHVIAVLECIQQSGCSDGTCVQQQCAAEYAVCGGAATPGGELTCGEMQDCYKTCDGDGDCIRSCTERGTPEAQALDQELSDCVSNSGCPDWACIEGSCAIELDNCHGPDW